MQQGRLLILAPPNKVVLLSADNRIDREHKRANEQSGERDHHEEQSTLGAWRMADHRCVTIRVTEVTAWQAGSFATRGS